MIINHGRFAGMKTAQDDWEESWTFKVFIENSSLTEKVKQTILYVRQMCDKRSVLVLFVLQKIKNSDRELQKKDDKNNCYVSKLFIILIIFHSVGNFNSCIQLLRERSSEKVHATIPKGIVGGFEFAVLHRNLKEWHERPWTYVFEC